MPPITGSFGALTARGFGLFSAPAAVLDEYFEYVTMLLPGNGTNGGQNNTFLDSSTNNFTITRNGNTTQGTFSPYGSNWSNYFDGTGDYLTVADAAGLEIGNEDFTIECWVYLTVGSAFQYLISKGENTDFVPYQITIDNTNKPNFYASTNGSSFAASMTSSTVMSLNSWNHIAVCRVGSAVTMYLNGTSVATGTVSGALYDNSRAVGIGGASDGGELTTGYLSNVRIVKGTAVYTSAFTPSTTPLTAVSGTALLTCQSNRFIDNSTNAFTITVNGNTSVQRFSPFSPTVSYATSTIGWSGYFDGSGDWLSVPDNTALKMGSSDFTYECWIYPTSIPNAYQTFIEKRASGGYAGVLLALKSTGKYSILVASSSTTWGIIDESTIDVTLNQWQHFAVVRSGSSFYVYLNGVRLINTTINFSVYDDTSVQGIGVGSSSADQPYFGYISDVRIVKGTAVYTASSFTPPTAPLTAITNTSLLTNFTNGSIIDNAMMNDLETVGNAQISTTQSKFGGSSIYFDGTGDVLTARENGGIFTFGTGDYTYECWIYTTTGATSQKTIFGRSNTGNINVPYIYLVNSTGVLSLYYTGTIVSSTAAISQDTWTHIAVCRSSGTTRLFINGTLDGSAADTTDLISPDILTIGGSGVAASNPFIGYIDDIRITKGYARYTSNFTPPTAALPTF
jgi:hypothetical protein